MKVVAEALGVSRSNLVERLAAGATPRRRHHKAQDAAVLPLVRRLVDARPTYGYRRITALLNRDLAAEGLVVPTTNLTSLSSMQAFCRTRRR